MNCLKRRPGAAFFLSVIFIFSSANLSNAALAPSPAPSPSNLNSESVRPVELARDPHALPDISDIFDGYSVDELPTDIATSAQPDLPPNDDGLLILELRMGRATLNEALIAYSTRNSVMLPLGGLADALQLAIRIDPTIGQAEGWIGSEEDSFKLDTKRHLVTLAGRVESVDAERIELKEDDIYVDMELLSQWLPVAFDFSFAEQLLIVKSADGSVLPIERLAKQELARRDLQLQPSDPSKEYPILRTPYTLGTVPFSDIHITHDYSEQSNPRGRTQGSILSHGDLLYMNQSSYVSYNKDTGLQDVRFTLSRTDAGGRLFDGDDPLSNNWLAREANDAALTNLEVGDIYSTELPLTMLGQDGRGVMVSNQPLNRSDQYDRTTINGNVQPNWEVELYRNEELLAFQRSASTGRYEFTDVPLLSGLNIFRVVFYGPFGETREEIRRVLVNENLTKKGESYFRFIAMEQGRNLVDTDSNSGSNFSSSLFGSTLNSASSNTRGMERYALEYEYGLDDQTALYTQVAHIPIAEDMETNAATIGLATVWEDVYGRIDLSRSDDDGTAVQLITQTNLWGINLSLRHQQFDNFLSDFTEDLSDPVKQRSVMRADTSLNVPILPRLSLGLAGAHTEYDSGRKRDELNQRTTTTLFGSAALNHNLTFTHDDIPGSSTGPTELTRGSALLSVPAWGAYIRGGVNYNITPDTELQSLSITSDYSIDTDTLIRGEIFREFRPNKYTYTSSLTHRFKHFSIGVNGGMTSEGDIIAGLSFNTAFGFEPRTDTFLSYAEPVSRLGLVSAKAFVDSNNNDLRDEGEEALEEVGYLVNNGPGSARSQDKINGVQMLKYINPHEPVALSVNPSSLENPFLVAGDSGVRVVSRPGTPMAVDFALKPATDVEGSVYVQRQGGEPKEASNVVIEAIDGNGTIVRSTRTAFDGIYLMELLPIGTYTLRVSPGQANTLGFDVSEGIHLEVTGKEEFMQDINFTISR